MTPFKVRVNLEVEFEVELELEDSTPANFNGHPDRWSPAEGGEVDVKSIKIVDRFDKKEIIGTDICDHLVNPLFDKITDAAILEVEEQLGRDI